MVLQITADVSKSSKSIEAENTFIMNALSEILNILA